MVGEDPRSFLPRSFPDYFSYSFENEVNHFANVLYGKESPIVKAKESIIVAMIAEALTESFYTGKVIPIPSINIDNHSGGCSSLISSSPDTRISTVLIGFGSFTKQTHFKNLQSQLQSKFNLKHIMKRNVPLEQTHDITYISDLSACWNDPMIDSVIISSPDSTHSSYIKTALEHGKHVFCEKPLSTSQDVSDCCCESLYINSLNSIIQII
jgi:predicted dehydrogenase